MQAQTVWSGSAQFAQTCLLRPVCPNTFDSDNKIIIFQSKSKFLEGSLLPMSTLGKLLEESEKDDDCKLYEPRHEKTNKTICAPSEDSYQPGHPPSLSSLHRPHEECP